MEPVRLPGRKETFLREVDEKFRHNIRFGPHGINMREHVNFNTEDAAADKYFKGPLSTNLDAQYVLVESPDIAIGTFHTVKVYHDLKRIPQGIICIAQAGVDKAAYPYTLRNVVYMYASIDNGEINWNKDFISINIVKIYGGAYPIRMILFVF